MAFFSHFVHHVAAGLLLAVTLADWFYVRSPRSEAVEPRALMLRWRRKLALWQMFLFLLVFSMGLYMWIPLIKAYPPHVFHTKAALAVVYLILAKVRMLKERRTQEPALVLTKLMGVLLGVLFLLGVWGGLGG